jgi:uncharacterized repeat protein (TIGR03803 family)
MKTSVKILFVRRMVILCLGLTLAARINAQTFTTLYSFSGSDGANPQAGLFLSANILYGTTFDDGGSGYGTVFKLDIDGTSFTTLHNFTGSPSDGANPQAGLILSSNTLYGTTLNGGTANSGTVFAVDTDGTGFALLHIFTAPFLTPPYDIDGAYPVAGLVLSNNTLYGTALSGGIWDEGAIFAINIHGTGFTNLHSFNQLFYNGHNINFDGAGPETGLILSGNTLYGTAFGGGVRNSGTVFSVSTDGTGPSVGTNSVGFTTLHTFTGGSDGANPQAGLVLSGNTLYGTANAGGSSGQGTVFAINTNGTGFSVLHSFTATDLSTRTNSDGANPVAGLILSANTLYGTTQNGGSSGNGTVFKVNTDGTGFTTLYNFTGGSDGANPMAGVILSGNTLYGTTSAGGNGGVGTVFSLSLGPVNPPQLTIVPAGTNVILTWTNTTSGFSLQSATNLVSPVWTTNSPVPVVVKGQNTVTNPISGTQQFFRLSH